jgi:phosphonate transport system substrate-binding protein
VILREIYLKTIFAQLWAFLCVLILVQPVHAANSSLKLGLWPYHSAHYLLNYYEGLRAQLESRLRLPVQLETAPSVEVFVERMTRGEYDLAIVAPHVARLAQTDYGWQPVARYLPDNQVYVVTRKQGGLKSVRDLKGKSIATPDRSMLLSMQAEKSLRLQGVTESDVQWQETGGLASSVFAVTSGQAEAAVCTQSSLALTPQADLDQLKVLVNAGSIPQLFVMAAPQVSRYRVKAAIAACLSYMPDEKTRLGLLAGTELRRLDGYATHLRETYAGRLAARPAPSGQN